MKAYYIILYIYIRSTKSYNKYDIVWTIIWPQMTPLLQHAIKRRGGQIRSTIEHMVRHFDVHSTSNHRNCTHSSESSTPGVRQASPATVDFLNLKHIYVKKRLHLLVVWTTLAEFRKSIIFVVEMWHKAVVFAALCLSVKLSRHSFFMWNIHILISTRMPKEKLVCWSYWPWKIFEAPSKFAQNQVKDTYDKNKKSPQTIFVKKVKDTFTRCFLVL